tara:strand:- start:10 stop:324 length:315 start_codon:yes stop_codon:yes gene_type:complete
MTNNKSENDTLCQKVKNFFNNIDCFLQCVFSDLETEQHTEIQQIEIEELPKIQKSIKIDESPKIDYGVEIEPYIESEINPQTHIFTVKKNNQMYQVVGRESIKI